MDNRWKDEVIEGLIQSGAYRNKLESDPKAAVQALVKQEVDMALDPLISEKARTLILRERDDCIETCVRRAESLREGSSVAYQCAQDIKMRKKP